MSKGVILAGGKGTRLLPFTKVINKHLLPVNDRPMIYYPIRTLRSLGIKDILIVTGGEHIGSFIDILGDGTDYGVKLTYRVQVEAGGIAQALAEAEGFVDGVFPVILGDNYFETKISSVEPAIVVKEVKHPERFGVYDGVRIVEKPSTTRYKHAVTGMYWYDARVFDVIKSLVPSGRGELEITDVNNWYLENGAKVINYPYYWQDMGTFEGLGEVIDFEKASTI